LQAITDDYLDALTGSFEWVVRVDAWRDGRLVAGDLPVSGGSLTVTEGQAIRSRLNVEITDPDGEFTPRTPSDALAPFGSELNVRLGIRVGPYVESFSQGWFPIQSCSTEESFASYVRPDEPGVVYRSSRGATTRVECVDRAQTIAEDRFIGREQPFYTSVTNEVSRLLNGRVPFAGAGDGVGVVAIPTTLTYDDDRLKAVTELADLADADLVMQPNGTALLVSRANGAKVWDLPEGEAGVRVSLSRTMNRDGVYNAFVARGQASDQRVLQAVELITSGPLEYDGPFGRVPYFMSSPLLTSDAAVAAAARTGLARISTLKPQAVTVDCVLNPALQVGDVVRLPLERGSVDGRVTGMALPLTAASVTMRLTVAVDPLAFAAVA
jgi:hypothetical protein